MVENTWRTKAPVILIAVLVMGWVLADAMNVRLPTDSRLPTIDSLLAHNADAESMKSVLRSTAVHDNDAAHLIAVCLLHENEQLREAGRSVAHDRLDKWQLDSPEDQQHLVTWLSGSIFRLLKDAGKRTVPTSEGIEITKRILAMAERPAFVDPDRRCVRNCLAVLSRQNGLDSTPRPAVANSSSSMLTESLKQSITAPVNYEAVLGATQNPE